ncbi:MAG: hypothetical protein Q7P63_00810 [Verrucomicrobiota bacterium JB022]|nr:hypothetical protein [Verrucomicrobiota bacterium JB022]
MKFLRKLFGGRKKPATPEAESQSEAPAKMQVVDEFGRMLEIPREQWYANVLKPQLEKVWSQPDELYACIVSAHGDGFKAEAHEASKRLYEIDPNRVRATLVWTSALWDTGEKAQAKRLLEEFRKNNPEDPAVLAHLARLRGKENKEAEAAELLRRALQLDPNHHEALFCYLGLLESWKGEAARIEGMAWVASLAGSWRVRLYQARESLNDASDLDTAVQHYRAVLEQAPQPVAGDILMQISGDLGNAGFQLEAVNLVAPHFDAKAHGFPVGNNLIKACLDLGQLDHARQLVDQLYAIVHVTQRPNLKYWEDEIAKLEVETMPPVRPDEIQVSQQLIVGPVWLPAHEGVRQHLAVPNDGGLTVAYVGSTFEDGSVTPELKAQRANGAGRFSRALPLLLAQEAYYRHHLEVATATPWLANDRGGFLIGRQPHEAETLANFARTEQFTADYVVATHLRCISDEQWEVDVRLIRTIDARVLDTFSHPVPLKEFAPAIPDLTRRVSESLAEHAEAPARTARAEYELPPVSHLANYLLRLEQMLTLRCYAAVQNRSGLAGEREIVGGILHLCLEQPKNVHLRVLLNGALRLVKRIKPAVVEEFRAQVEKLDQAHPLEGPLAEALRQWRAESIDAKEADAPSEQGDETPPRN